MKSRVLIVLVVLAAAAIYLVGATAYVLSEGQQALVVRLGAPIAVETQPGLKFKAPFIDSLYVYDTRLLMLEPPVEQVILGDQKRLEVQPYTRYRIVDPLRFYQALRTNEQARAQLTQLVSSSLRRELGQISLADLLTDKRAAIVDAIRGEVAAKVASLGLSIEEVRFHRADLPFETSQAIYDRMKSERQREAKELRAQGFEWAQQIQSKADRERTVTLSQAQEDATVSRGAGDAEASRLLADAFGTDAKFYQFYRSLQTYKKSLAESGPTLLLSPEASFVKMLSGGPEAPADGAAPK